MLSGPLTATLTIQRDGDQLHVRGLLSGTAAETCSRCGTSFERSFESELMVIADGPPEPGTMADGIEDDDFIVHDGRDLDLGETIRQLVLLSGPMAPICREDCRGLCPHCGADRNRTTCTCRPEAPDPRWQALDDVLRKSKPAKGD